MKKRWIFLILLLALSNWAMAQLEAGVDYSNRYFWIVFHPALDNIEIQQVDGKIRSGYSSVDALFDRFRVKQVVPEVPFAQPWDRDGDIKFSNVFRVEVEPTDNILQIIEKFNDDPYLVLAEAIPIYYPEEVTPYIPNDPYFSSEWHLTKIQAHYAWGMWEGATPGSDTVVVAIIDTGVDWNHPDLIQNLWNNLGEDANGNGKTVIWNGSSWEFDPGDVNGVDDDGNGYIDDFVGWDFCGSTTGNFQPDNDPHSSPYQGFMGMLMHGTHVAGTASPTTDNGTGVAGPGFQAKLMAIKVAFDDDINNTPGVYATAATYLYAARSGAHVINCSFGGPGYSGIIQSAINTAHDVYGSIIVAAAGNDNQNNQYNHHYPSDYQNVIAVAALNSGDQKASFSNYGTPIDISAPGVNIWSTVYQNVGSGYQGAGWSGTSMASPVVAGSIALLKAFYPTRSNSWLEQRIIDSADPIDDYNPSYVGMLGSGRVNLYAAIAQGIYPNITFQNYSVQVVGQEGGDLSPGQTANLRVTLRNENGWHVATNVQAVLRSQNSGIIVLDSTATFPDISGGSIGINLVDVFQIQVDSSATIGSLPMELYVTANQDSAYPYDVTLNFDIEISINQAGWPQTNTGTILHSPVVWDMDDDGANEVVANSGNGNVYAWELDGTMMSGFPYATGAQIISAPAVGDVDGDGHPEIVVTTKGNHLYVIQHTGLAELDYDAGEQLWGTPGLFDLDGDGDLEIVFGTFSGKLRVIQHDGADYGNFPVDLGLSHRILGGVAIGDVNDDGVEDLVFGTFNGDVYAISSGDASILTGFPVNVGARVESAPVIADLDQGGSNGVRIAVTSLAKNLTILDGQGNTVGQYSYGGSIIATPAVVDLDQDGNLDLVFGCTDNKLYAVDMNGNSLSGFPIATGNDIRSSASVADIDNDGSPEIAFASTDGKLYLVHADGSAFTGFPINVVGLLSATPTIADLDEDGDLELLLGTPSSLNIYDVPGSGTAENYWNTLQGNYHRTSNYADVVTGIHYGEPAQTVQDFTLLQNYPNPFNPVTEIRYYLPTTSRVQLTVYNLLGQKVRTLVQTSQQPGWHHVQWNGRNDLGQKVSSGVYIYKMTAGRYQAVRKMILMK